AGKVIRGENMATTVKRTISLSREQADFLDTKVGIGGYASASEVVRAGLRALKERDEAVERWLREEVAPVYDAMLASPSRARPAKQVFKALHKHHQQRTKQG